MFEFPNKEDQTGFDYLQCPVQTSKHLHCLRPKTTNQGIPLLAFAIFIFWMVLLSFLVTKVKCEGEVPDKENMHVFPHLAQNWHEHVISL